LRMPVVESKLETRVLVGPSCSLQQGEVRTIQLRHPRTKSAAVFLSTKTSLCEILSFQEEHRSWTVGQRMLADGRLVLATPCSPIFLVIPYLAKAERLVPLDQMLEDKDFPLSDEVLGHVTGLEVVADRKGSEDLNVWKYSEEKTLAWLKVKVEKVATLLEKQGVDTTQGAASLNYKAIGAQPGKVEYTKYALGIVSEYISPELASALEATLGLPLEVKKEGVKRGTEGQVGKEPKAKKAKLEGPSEDYSKSAVKAVVKEEQNAKQKALAISAKGTKSISNFFTKKNK